MQLQESQFPWNNPDWVKTGSMSGAGCAVGVISQQGPVQRTVKPGRGGGAWAQHVSDLLLHSQTSSTQHYRFYSSSAYTHSEHLLRHIKR